MGSQVGFYMTHEDELAFLDAIRQLGALKIVYNTFGDESQMEIPALQPVGAASIHDANLSLVNPSVAPVIKRNYYPTQSYYCIDLFPSEVVQFNRCELHETWLGNGRLWFQGRGLTVEKSPEFQKWADSLLRWIRRKYHKDARGFYVAPQALELSNAGKLQLGPSEEPVLSLEERKRIFGIA